MMRKQIVVFGLIGLLVLSGGVASSLQSSVKPMRSVAADSFDLLIIAPATFKDELGPLVDHKNDLGVDTELVTLDTILSSSEASMGRDDAEKIKYYIKYAMETFDISYVLLVGGRMGQFNKWYMPVRYVGMDNGWEPHYIAELYFADIYDSSGDFSSWDADGDGVYGEWVKGEDPVDTGIDLYPDIAVGRLPCRNSRQVKDAVNKIIYYETASIAESSWFQQMLAIAGDTYLEQRNSDWVGFEGEFYADQAIDHMDEFTATRMYLSEGAFDGPDPVVSEFNKGYGFVYFVGHGNPSTWGNHPPDDHEFVTGMSNMNMYQLSNDQMFPVCVVSGCHNCQLDVHLLNLLEGIIEEGQKYFNKNFWRNEWVPESWGWRMTRLPDAGSIVTFGTAALGHTKEDKTSFTGGINELEVELFRQMGQEDVLVAGDVLKETISWYLDTYPVNWAESNATVLEDTWVDVQVAQSYLLFGDPSLRIGGYS